MKDVTNIVKMILIEEPSTRDNDRTLYLSICRHINPLTIKLPFEAVFEHPEKYGLPYYDSVSRARRKVQEKDESLGGSTRATERRSEKFKEMYEYALSEI